MTALPASFAAPASQNMQQDEQMPEEQQQDQQGRSMFGSKSFKQAYDAAAKTARSASQATQAAARSAADAIQPAVASLVAAGQSAGTKVQNGVHNLSSRSRRSSANPAQQGLIYNTDHSAMRNVEEEGSAFDTSQRQQSAPTSLLQAAAELGSRARDTSSAAITAAYANIKRMTTTTPNRNITAMCKADFSSKPCPQVLLLCCNLIAIRGLEAPSDGLFSGTADPDQLQAAAVLIQRLEGHAMLIPTDTAPLVASHAIKLFLSSLIEPLLCVRLAGRWVSAGMALDAGDSSLVEGLLQELPTANLTALRLLVETCFLLVSKSALTGLDAHMLSQELAPVLLWWGEQGPTFGLPNNEGVSTGQALANQAALAVASLQALKTRLARGSTHSTTQLPSMESVTGEDNKREDGERMGLQLGARASAPGNLHVANSMGAQSDTGAGERVPLQGEDLDAVVRVLEHLIVNLADVWPANSL